MSNTHHPILPAGHHGLVLALWLYSATLGFAELAAAQPAQVPLTSSSTPPPQPNVMVMIDDSGSMASDAVPEGTFKVNGFDVTFFQNYSTGAFPGDPNLSNNISADVVNETVLQVNYRSPDINRLFYNPDVLYTPWWSTSTDASGQLVRMSAAVPSKAFFDPVLNQASFYDLSTNTPPIPAVPGTKGKKGKPAVPGFNPGIYYRLKTGADPNQVGSFVRYDVNSTDSTPYAPSVKSASRTDCLGTSCTKAEELQNFANWFTYYRTRILMTKGAVIETYYNFQNQIRTGWGSINGNSSSVANFNKIQRGMGQLDLTYLKTLVTDVGQIKPNSTTPLRTAIDQVGGYFSTGTPWLNDLNDSGSGSSSCRRSANVLMTDGYYNDESYTGPGNVDGVDGNDCGAANNVVCNNPGNYQPIKYIAKAPNIYTDGYSNTLADVAMKYYVTDLQPSIDNRVKPTASDFAFWQHLTQYTVGVGVRGTLDASSPAAKKATLVDIAANKKSWPDPGPATISSTNPEKIDDLWHAAVNTGGDYFPVSSSTELVSALNDAFRAAVQAPLSEGGVAVSANTLVTGSLKLVPWYTAGSWTGELNAYALDATGAFPTTPTWSASAVLPAWASRNLFTWDGSSSVAFKASAMGTLQASVGATSLTDYIRGDTSNEGPGSTQYRSRNGKLLGDFVDSAPVYVKDLVNLGYSNLDAGYDDYVTKKAGRSSSLVFQGGNAGILHAFDGATGVEKYGYLPKAGLANLHIIAQQDYGTQKNYHRFFVDGPLLEADAYIATGGATSADWSNLVLGSMGAGGTGIFALHVDTTDPAGATLGANTLLWEKSASDITNLGNVVSTLATGKLPGSGGWVALVGNGAFSKNGAASLLVLDLASGAVKQELVVDNTGSNGLMGVTLLQNINKEVVGAYAGDLQGNLWRFDFDASGTGAIGFNKKPLFTALGSGSGQAITAAPQWVPNPAGNGRIVVFGTGKLLSTTDASSTQQQTLYGVLDPTADGTSSANAVSPFDGVTNARTVLAERVASKAPMTNPKSGITTSYYAITGSAINWGTQKGWYMDLPFPDVSAGGAAQPTQREVYPVAILEGAYALFQTIVPPASAADCDTAAGAGYNYLLEAATGLPSSTPTFDTDHNGTIDATDLQKVGGFSTKADGSDKIVKIMDCAGTGLCPDGKVLYGDTSSDSLEKMAITKPLSIIKDRVWRQIMNPPL